MTPYLVIWEIDVEADSPEDAARQARAIQQDWQNMADHFTVISGKTARSYEVNVLELPE